ncbi:hypothetical protein CCACVL1_16270 [Corchorus capsularis]|uniref:ZF-HD dimerization-type domain-containing protein n=1 Tax=Corchorus capsularis TaxID=210143 RepID=A0A1R3HY25_COCAP|nr:hypothetical protein CCACVL1_16270 [Corchorus capsularis]
MERLERGRDGRLKGKGPIFEPVSLIHRCCSHVRAEAELCRYKECKRNHGIPFGRYAFDGCGEFMKSSDEDPYKCAACGCHRNFHRKEPCPADTPQNNRNNSVTLAPPTQAPTPEKEQFMSPLPLATLNGNTGESSSFPRVDKNLDAGSETQSGVGVGVRAGLGVQKGMKIKRTRTRFTLEQKQKMTRFAVDRLGWRLHRTDETDVLNLCKDLGISRHVFVVWMNNTRRRIRNKRAGTA